MLLGVRNQEGQISGSLEWGETFILGLRKNCLSSWHGRHLFLVGKLRQNDMQKGGQLLSEVGLVRHSVVLLQSTFQENYKSAGCCANLWANSPAGNHTGVNSRFSSHNLRDKKKARHLFPLHSIWKQFILILHSQLQKVQVRDTAAFGCCFHSCCGAKTADWHSSLCLYVGSGESLSTVDPLQIHADGPSWVHRRWTQRIHAGFIASL